MNVNPFSYLIEKLKGKVDKSGDTMSGTLKIDQQNGTISTEGYSYIHLGNSTPTGTNKNSTGSIRLFAGSGKYTNIVAGNLTANRAIVFPDNGGTVALTSDLNWNLIQAGLESGTTIDFDATKYHDILIVPMANGNAWYNPFTVPNELPSQVYFSVYQDGTYHAAAHIVYNSGTKRLTYTTDSVAGWARLYIKIYAR